MPVRLLEHPQPRTRRKWATPFESFGSPSEGPLPNRMGYQACPRFRADQSEALPVIPGQVRSRLPTASECLQIQEAASENLVRSRVSTPRIASRPHGHRDVGSEAASEDDSLRGIGVASVQEDAPHSGTPRRGPSRGRKVSRRPAPLPLQTSGQVLAWGCAGSGNG